MAARPAIGDSHGLPSLRDLMAMSEEQLGHEEAAGPPPLTFRVSRGATLVRVETLRSNTIKVGTLPSSHLRLDDDPLASRMHAVIELDSGNVSIIDLGSAAGTLVNGVRVNRSTLKSGDELMFGSTRVVLSVGTSPAWSTQAAVDDLQRLMARSAADYAGSNWASAFEHYMIILAHHREALSKEELTDVFYRLGVVKREQGERRKALNMFDKALEEDPRHRPTLEAVVGLHEKSSDWGQVIQFKKRILEQLSGDERFTMLENIGDLWHEKLKDASKAIEHYALASEMWPKHHRLLHKLLGLYQSTKQWDQAIDIIDRVSSLVSDMDVSEETKKAQQSKYAYTMGVIAECEIKDSHRALKYFTTALDLDPTQLRAFEAMSKILSTRKEWKQLERAYRAMLHRVARARGMFDPGVESRLWHGLGVVYRDELSVPDAAAEAFRQAFATKPRGLAEQPTGVAPQTALAAGQGGRPPVHGGTGSTPSSTSYVPPPPPPKRGGAPASLAEGRSGIALPTKTDGPAAARPADPPLHLVSGQAPHSWHCELDGAAAGPFADSELDELRARGLINGRTQVWRAGMPGWIPLDAVLGTVAPGTPNSAQRADDPEPQARMERLDTSVRHQPPPARRIFICYRRDDSQSVTDRIFEKLEDRLGRNRIFRDIDNIPYGVDFREHVAGALGECDVLLCIIGRKWTDIADKSGRQRLASARDHVRIELETAFRRQVAVIPVLVEDGEMPEPESLPTSLGEKLPFMNAVVVRSGRDFKTDFERLVELLQGSTHPKR